MDAARLEKLDIENVSIISQELGVEFWSHTVIALTFANLVLFKCPSKHRKDDASMEMWFQRRLEKWKKLLRLILSEAGVPVHTITTIPFLPVGHHKPTCLSPKPWVIPCDKNWMFSFVSAVNKKLSNDTVGGKQKLVTTGIGGGIAAGVGLAAGAIILGPVGIVAGGVVGAVGGAVGAYALLKAKLSNKEKTDKSNSKKQNLMLVILKSEDVVMALVYKVHIQGGSDNTTPFPHNHSCNFQLTENSTAAASTYEHLVCVPCRIIA